MEMWSSWRRWIDGLRIFHSREFSLWSCLFALLLVDITQTRADNHSLEGTLYIEGRDFFARPIVLHRFDKSQTKEAWPLTVDTAWIGCRADFANFTTIIFVENEAWALNGITRGWAKKRKYELSIGGISYLVRVDDDNSDLWWWADHPEWDDSVDTITNMERNPDKLIGPKIDIDPVFDFLEGLGCLKS